MSVLQVEVVVRPVDVAGHDGGELDAVLVGVHSVHHVDHALGEAVAVVGRVRGAQVDLKKER